jgi:DNA-directed RNA polymerase specialized sigma24 family protein
MASILELDEWPTPATYLYEKYAEALQRQLRRRFQSTDADLIYDAVIAAILDIALKFDRLKAPENLRGLLFVAALRKLLASLRSETSRQLREAKTGNETVVKQQAATREQWQTLADAEILERAFKTVPENEDERLVLEHWGADFQEIAFVLGWKDLPEADQYKRVKTLRDRLGQRLRRLIEDPE